MVLVAALWSGQPAAFPAYGPVNVEYVYSYRQYMWQPKPYVAVYVYLPLILTEPPTRLGNYPRVVMFRTTTEDMLLIGLVV